LAQHALLRSHECLYPRSGWWWWWIATSSRRTNTNQGAACRFHHLKYLSFHKIHIRKLVLTSRTCTTKNSIGTKVRLKQRHILELRISCAQLKTMRIHDSKVHYNAKVSSHWISILESKALSRVEEFGTGVLFWRWGTKIPTQTPGSQNFPNFHQQLRGIIMHSKVDLDGIESCSKIYICRGRLP
jgi:hypothetical protein